MKQRKYRLLTVVNKLLPAIVLLSFVGCNGISKLSKHNTANYYLPNHKQNLVTVNYQANKDSLNRINFFIDEKAALNEFDDTFASIKLSVYNSYNERKAIFEVENQVEFLQVNEFIGSIDLPLKIEPNQKIYYSINASFLNTSLKGIYVYNENKFNSNFIVNNDSSFQTTEIENWKYQSYINEPAKVPFEEQEIKWQYNYQLNPINKSDIFSKAGYYVADNESIYFAINEFPTVTKPDELVAPLRYITTDEEYQQLKTAQITKLQIDTFWFNMAGNFERARKLIKEYYQRVAYANQYFTTYKEGWMTDRGMIYIIYGPADEVYQHDDVEIWYHRNSDTKFIFDKVKIPGSKQHFVLQRNIELKNSWHQAVNNWRNGQLKSTFKK